MLERDSNNKEAEERQIQELVGFLVEALGIAPEEAAISAQQLVKFAFYNYQGSGIIEDGVRVKVWGENSIEYWFELGRERMSLIRWYIDGNGIDVIPQAKRLTLEEGFVKARRGMAYRGGVFFVHLEGDGGSAIEMGWLSTRCYIYDIGENPTFEDAFDPRGYDSGWEEVPLEEVDVLRA